MSGRSSSFCVCVLVLLALFWPTPPLDSTASISPQQGGEDVDEISLTLGLRLYRALRADRVQNPLFSPLLLATSLATLGGRAGGSTAQQLQEALNSSALPLSNQWGALSGALKSTRSANGTSFHLHSSSALFTKQAPSLDPQFLEEVRTRSLLEHVPLGDDQDALLAWAKRGMGGANEAELAGEIKAKSGGLILAHALHFRGKAHRVKHLVHSANSWSLDEQLLGITKYTLSVLHLELNQHSKNRREA